MPMGAHAAAHSVRPSRLITVLASLLLLLSTAFPVLAQHPYVAAQALLNFKSSLANANPALANWNASVSPCPAGNSSQGNWAGVLCYNGFVWGLQLENINLQGQINVDALVPLRYLRALSFMNNNFEGQMPDWRKVGALKSLYLSNNKFSGTIPADAFRGMTSLKKVHLANNRFNGNLPTSLESPKLIELRLENNQFTGTIPSISSEFLNHLNVSNNQLEGPIPKELSKLDPSSFAGNRGLCGPPLAVACNPTIPPPDAEPNLHPPEGPATGGADSSQGMSSSVTAIIIVCALLFLLLLILIVFFIRRKNNSSTPQLGRALVTPSDDEAGIGVAAPGVAAAAGAAAGASPPKKVEHQQQPGKLTFVRDDRQKFDLQDLMRASAEVLGSGNFGASYKAVLVDGEALVVKRFKLMNNIAKEDFQEHMRRIGRLKHANLLPLVAYLYRKEEKLLVFEFVHNGSLASNLHGKHSEEKPGLSWATRLRIIKGVAKGLLYLQTELPSLVVSHGHLKSSNVLLDRDYNPLLMDYTLVPVVNPNQVPQILVAYKSPEYAREGRTTKKTDVWCLGVLILETMTGRYVAKHLDQGSGPYGPELAGWINEIVRDASANSAQVFDKEMNAPSTCRPEMEKLLQIAIGCCKEDADDRLEMEEVVRQIEQIQDSSTRQDSSSRSSNDNMG